MTRNHFLQFNNIIYTLYGVSDFSLMKIQLLKELKSLIPCTFCSILMHAAPNADSYLTDPVCYPPDYIDVENRYLRLEHSDQAAWIADRVNHLLYKECYVPYQLQYAIYTTLAHKETPLGGLNLYREKALGDFSEDDIFLLRAVARHLSLRFYQETVLPKAACPNGQSGVVDFAARYGLTNRELEVFLAVTPELTNEALAEKLCISEFTLKKHVQSLYRKTGSKRKLELIHLKNSLNQD